MSNNAGVIYILTNPSFQNYVKIGYATDINKRLHDLNSSECTPFAFRVYATYAVPSSLSDKKLHAIIDKLNPDLRSVDNLNGKPRIREFYAMRPNDAYGILEAMAEIHNCMDKLTLYPMSDAQKQDETTAQDIDTKTTERASNFSFTKCQIPIGAVIQYCDDPSLTAIVVDDRNVSYQGKPMSLTALAKLLSGKKYSIAGPMFFKYQGEWLNDIRRKMGV